MTRRLVGSNSYFVLRGTVVQFRLKGLGTPLEDLVREYKYTGNSFLHDDHFRRYEYVYLNKQTGENRLVYIQKKEGDHSKIRPRIFQRLSDRRRLRYYVGHYDPKKYKEQMQRYKQGEINTRPNGRVWCLLSDTLEIRTIGDDWIKLDEYYRLVNRR